MAPFLLPTEIFQFPGPETDPWSIPVNTSLISTNTLLFLYCWTTRFEEWSTFVHSLENISWKVTMYQSLGTQTGKAPPSGSLWFHYTDKPIHLWIQNNCHKRKTPEALTVSTGGTNSGWAVILYNLSGGLFSFCMSGVQVRGGGGSYTAAMAGCLGKVA